MIFYWTETPTRALLAQAGLDGDASADIGPATRMLGFAIAMIPLGALIFGLLSARRCFAAFAAGQIFSIETIGRLKAFAIAVALSAMLKPFAGAALVLLLAWNVPAIPRRLALTFDSDSLLSLIFAATVAILAWVMTEAIEIAEENKQFV